MRVLLLESNRRTSVNVSVGLTSLLLHGTLIAVAVLATQVTPRLLEKAQQHDLVYLDAKVTPPQPQEVLENIKEAVIAAIPEGFKILQTPVMIPDAIPPVDLTQSITKIEDWSGRGAPGGVANGVKGAPPPPIEIKETYTVAEVDEAPTMLSSKVAPRYPDILRSAGVEGEVIAEFVVDTLGRADLSSFRVVKESHQLFTNSVRSAVAQMRFAPARMGEHKVRTLVQMPFTFKIEREE